MSYRHNGHEVSASPTYDRSYRVWYLLVDGSRLGYPFGAVCVGCETIETNICGRTAAAAELDRLHAEAVKRLDESRQKHERECREHVERFHEGKQWISGPTGSRALLAARNLRLRQIGPNVYVIHTMLPLTGAALEAHESLPLDHVHHITAEQIRSRFQPDTPDAIVADWLYEHGYSTTADAILAGWGKRTSF